MKKNIKPATPIRRNQFFQSLFSMFSIRFCAFSRVKFARTIGAGTFVYRTAHEKSGAPAKVNLFLMMRYSFSILIMLLLLVLGSPACRHDSGLMTPPEEPGTGTGGNNGGTGGNNGGGNNGGGTGGGNTPTGVPCDPDSVYFDNQVLPILVSNCAKPGCHDAASHQDGVVLSSYASLMSTVDDVNDRAAAAVAVAADRADSFDRHQSYLMFASRITFPNFADSLRMRATYSSGVDVTGSPPSAVSRVFTEASFPARTIAA